MEGWRLWVKDVNIYYRYDGSTWILDDPDKIYQTLTPADSVSVNWAAGSAAYCLLDRATTTFAFTGAPGTSPLPIFQAYFAGTPLSNTASNRNPANYTHANYRASSWYNSLNMYNPTMATMAGTGTSGLSNAIGTGIVLDANRAAAGLPINFFIPNPAVAQGNAYLETNITVEIEQLLGDVFDRLFSRDFEMSMLDITVMTPDPDSALYWFQRSGTAVNIGYVKPLVDELLDGAREEADQAKREEMYAEALQLVLDDAPYIFTVHRNMIWA